MQFKEIYIYKDDFCFMYNNYVINLQKKWFILNLIGGGGVILQNLPYFWNFSLLNQVERINLLPIYEECNTLGSSTYFLNTRAETLFCWILHSKTPSTYQIQFYVKKELHSKNIKSLQRVSKFNVLQTLNSFKIFLFCIPKMQKFTM